MHCSNLESTEDNYLPAELRTLDGTETFTWSSPRKPYLGRILETVHISSKVVRLGKAEWLMEARKRDIFSERITF